MRRNHRLEAIPKRWPLTGERSCTGPGKRRIHRLRQSMEARVTFFVVGLNHKTAPVELREQLAVSPSNLVGRTAELKLRDDLDEIVLLSTCNRVEIYGAARRPRRITQSLLGSLCVEPHDFRSCAYVYEDRDAVRHLFRVAAGMDSMVLGETEISGQVKQAYE